MRCHRATPWLVAVGALALAAQAACVQLLGIDDPGGGDAPAQDAAPVDGEIPDADPGCAPAPSFGNETNYQASGRVTTIATGDLDNDGMADVAISELDLADAINIWHGNGDGQLSRQQKVELLPEVTAVDRVLVGDVDSDGFDDLVVQVRTVTPESKVFLLRQDSTLPGSFLPPVVALSSPTMLPTAELGDVNDDGDLDVVAIGGMAGDELLIGLHQPGSGGGFTALPPISMGAQSPVFFVMPPLIGDIDGDGAADLAVIAGGRARLLLQDPLMPGEFSSPMLVGPNNADSMAIGPMDADALDDLVIIHATGTSLFVQTPATPRSFSQGPALPPAFSSTEAGRASLRDVNGDDRPDLVSERGVLLRCGPAAGETAFEAFWSDLGSGQPTAFIDLNADGKTELLILDQDRLAVRIQQ